MKVPAALLVGINNFVKHVMGNDPDPVARQMRSLYLGMNKETLEMGKMRPGTLLRLTDLLRADQAPGEMPANALEITFKTEDGKDHIGVII